MIYLFIYNYSRLIISLQYANLKNNKNTQFKSFKCAKIMINFKLTDKQACFFSLTDQLLKTDNWALINNNSHATLVRQIKTGKIYQLVFKKINNNSCIQQQNFHIDEEGYYEENVSSDNNSIFLQKIRLTDDYYLQQKSVMTLSDRVMKNKLNNQPILYTEKEILQTFIPIIKSICQKQFPSSYQLTSNLVHIDFNQNIRLSNSSTYMLNRNDSLKSFNIFQQMAIVILQSALLKTTQEAIKLMESEENLVLLLIQRHYSHEIIGLIFILIHQCQNFLPITLYDFIREGFNLCWFENMRINIQKKYKTLNEKKQFTPKKIRKPIQDSQEQTEESCLITLSKYRQGLRIQKTGINNQNCQELNDDIYYKRHLKTRKRLFQKEIN